MYLNRHAREGGHPVRGASRLYKCRFAVDQTPAFAGVTERE
jgi:hypothetical protein